MRLPFQKLGYGKVVGEVTHGGMTLPVYHPRSVIWHDTELQRLSRGTRGDTAVRYIRVNPQVRFVLSELLTTADDVFDKVARSCGGTAVKHSWGLSVPPKHLRDIEDDNKQYLHADLPDALSLVAKVDVIHGAAEPHRSEWLELYKNIAKHHTDPSFDHMWIDGRADQMLRNNDGLFLVDIEPFIRPVQARPDITA